MTFEEALDQALMMVQRRGRVTYRTLKLQFALDDDRFEALKEALLFAHSEIRNEEDRGLVWTGEEPLPEQNPLPATDTVSRSHALLPVIMVLLQRERRVTYRRLQYVFAVDDRFLQEVRSWSGRARHNPLRRLPYQPSLPLHHQKPRRSCLRQSPPLPRPLPTRKPRMMRLTLPSSRRRGLPRPNGGS